MATSIVLPPEYPYTLFAYGINWVCPVSLIPPSIPVQETDLIDKAWKGLQQTSKVELQSKHLTRLFKLFPRDVDVSQCEFRINEKKLYLVCGKKQWIWMQTSANWTWIPQKDLDTEPSAPKTGGFTQELRDTIDKCGLTPDKAHIAWMLQKLPSSTDLRESHVTYDGVHKAPVLSCGTNKWIWSKMVVKPGLRMWVWTPL